MTGDTDTLKFYYPALVMIAITLTKSGHPHLFKDLYPAECENNVSGFISKNVINFFACLGILFSIIKLSLLTGNIGIGVVSGIICLFITYPLSQTVLPFFIEQGDKALRNITKGDVDAIYSGNWDKYIIGAFYILLLMGLQYFAIMAIYNYFLSNM
jgi:hypothetical protein